MATVVAEKLMMFIISQLSILGVKCATSKLQVCPRCHVLIVKMDDGSCNHMTCSVCGSEFCWLCMKEISGKKRGSLYFTNRLHQAKSCPKHASSDMLASLPFFEHARV